MLLELNIYHTCAIAVLVLMLGGAVRKKVNFLQTYCIPTPVVGGLIFTILTLIGHQTGSFNFKFNFVLSDFFMLIFYSGIGFTASIKLLKKGGVKVITFLIVSSVLVLLQNGLGAIMAKLIGVGPLIGIATGSIPMTGGHGTSAAFAPVLEQAGLANATTITLAAATFGLVAGSLVGGPVGRYLVEKSRKREAAANLQGFNISETENLATKDFNIEVESKNGTISEKRMASAVYQLFLAMALGSIISQLLAKVGLTFPASVGGMLASAIFTNIADYTDRIEIKYSEIKVMGDIALSIFLAMSMMKLQLWQLVDLAVPMLILLFVQTVLMILFAIYITYKVMGNDYEAAVMSSGHCGFGLGAVPTAMANMKTLEEKYGPAKEAFFIVPLVGSLFINFVNSILITLFINIL